MSPGKSAPAVRGAIYSWLRERGEVKIGAETSPEAIRARFGITPKRFWHTIEALRRDRELAVEGGRIRFLEPHERW
jgi:predicted RNA-binding protein (virulence factor B family)